MRVPPFAYSKIFTKTGYKHEGYVKREEKEKWHGRNPSINGGMLNKNSLLDIIYPGNTTTIKKCFLNISKWLDFG